LPVCTTIVSAASTLIAIQEYKLDIKNLNINILHYICDHLQRNEDDHQIAIDLLGNEFSDIPKSELELAVDSLAEDQMINTDEARLRLSITRKGISHLRSSVACQTRQFAFCACGEPY
jgi:hypothetical protein